MSGIFALCLGVLMYPEAYNIQAALPQLTPSTYRLLAPFRIEAYTATNLPRLARSLAAFVVKAVLHHEVLLILRMIYRMSC